MNTSANLMFCDKVITENDIYLSYQNNYSGKTICEEDLWNEDDEDYLDDIDLPDFIEEDEYESDLWTDPDFDEEEE